MTYLSAPEALTTKQRTYRYLVALASNKLDHEGIPERFQTVDVVVLEPSQAAISTLMTAAGWLDDWGIVDYWVPEDCSKF